MLLAFDTIALALFVLASAWGNALGRLTGRASGSPVVLFIGLTAVSAVLYVPLALVVSPLRWTALGPFSFQTSRILHYLAYFLTGLGVGAWGLERGLLAPNGKLARRWLWWVTATALVFLIRSAVAAAYFRHLTSFALRVVVHTLSSVFCAAACFAFLALFVRFARAHSRAADSLDRNSYGIYIVHYAFVSWLQYVLLAAPLPPAAKFAVVFAGALVLSWGIVIFMRRLPGFVRMA